MDLPSPISDGAGYGHDMVTQRLIHLDAYYDLVPVGLCVIDQDLRFVSINRRLAEMTGRPASADIGCGLAEVAPGVAAQLEPHLRHALAGQRVTDVELQGTMVGMICEGRTFLASLEPLRDGSGEVTGALCSVVDITERKHAEAALAESEDHYRHVVELSPHVPWTADPQGNILEVSQRWMHLSGMPIAESLGNGWARAVYPEDVELTMEAWRQSVRTGKPLDIEYRLRLVDGGYRWFRARAIPRRAADGAIIRWYGILEDIHDRKIAEWALQESKQRLDRAIAAADMAAWEWDYKTDHLHVSAGYDKLFGFPPTPVRTLAAMLDAVHPEDRDRITAAVKHALDGDADGDHEVTFRVPLADGTEHWLRACGRAERAADGTPLRLIGVTHDITVQRRAEQQIWYLANHDPLTDLPNRRLFHQELEIALSQMRMGEHIALHCLDLDQFKIVNDTMGHTAGDALLRKLADRLRRCVGPRDIIARLGGDEFAIVQPRVQDVEDAAGLARRLVMTLGEACDIGGQNVAAGISIGIALVPEDGIDAAELMRNADIALYSAKAEGRGTFRFFEPRMDAAVRKRQEIRVGLRAAFERGELEMHYQPLVDLHSGDVTCCEALMRWRRPGQAPVSPSDFIPVAEETGMIMQLGEWALRTACRAAAGWPAPVRVAVNLSPVQFRDPGLVETVASALKEACLPPGRLELEITESSLLQDDEATLAILHRLRGLGVRIVLDDFGTGFSSLGYLLRFRFDKIKIDRSFITDLLKQDKSQTIIGAVVGMGHGLGMVVTAEGVEETGQLEAVRKKGCNEAQGFLFSVPVLASDVPNLLTQLQRSSNASRSLLSPDTRKSAWPVTMASR